MKKILSILLCSVMLFSCVLPATAADGNSATVPLTSRSRIPIVTISGDGDPLYDTEGNKVLHYKSLINSASDEASEEEKENIKQSVMNVLYPFLLEGVLTDQWDGYYDALEKEIADLFGDALLDENGNASNGVDIAPNRYETNAINMRTDNKENGTYGVFDYYFYYDWRLDPLETADKLNEYITAVKNVTGYPKVGLIGRCLGTSVVAAYIKKYGMDDIQGVAINGSVVNGAEVLSEAVSGKFSIDANAINRFIADCEALGIIDVDSFITASIDLLDKNGVLDTVVGVTKEQIYGKLVYGVTSALALSTFYTWPCYWAAVSSEDYDDALCYVFGKEGSEKRVKYAGLIEKLDNYNEEVRQNLAEIFETIADNGNICIISKYGFQIVPICRSHDEVGDQFASVKYTSRGATTSTVYGTLSDSYIAKQTAAGLGRYISPDKQIDASTCQFPDNTWFVKGSSHSNWTKYENNILLTVVSADTQLTVNDLECTQYMVWDYRTGTMSAMTEENCDTYNWEADDLTDHPTNPLGRLFVFLRSLFKWFAEAFRFIKSKQEPTP